MKGIDLPEISGYLHRDYAASLDAIGVACELPRCAGWILEREIPLSGLKDAVGCYPLFSCRDWQRLPEDLAAIAGRLVSLTIVTDPFGRFTPEDLCREFDVVLPYKAHYVTDLASYGGVPCTRRHKRNTGRALQHVRVERVRDPLQLSDAWVGLYRQLVARRLVSGFGALSPEALRRQLTVPGTRLFSATAGDDLVGLHVWYVQGQVAYGHLGATSQRGYDLMASYALYAVAIEQLREEVRWLALGSSAGTPEAASGHGLRQFKAGWATGTRPTYVCGRILEPDAYARLSQERGGTGTSWFPAYRRDESDRDADDRPTTEE